MGGPNKSPVEMTLWGQNLTNLWATLRSGIDGGGGEGGVWVGNHFSIRLILGVWFYIAILIK